MKTTDFNKKITSRLLNENFSKIYGSKINLSKYSTEQLEDFRNKIRTKLSQVESLGKFNETLENSNYQRDKMVLDVINTYLEEKSEETAVLENVDPKQAGVVQAAIDMQNKIKNMLEDIGAMMTKSMVALSDDIKDTIGPEAAEQFTQIVTPALETAMQNLQGTRASIEQGVGVLTGETVPNTIGAEPGMDAGVEPATDMDTSVDVDQLNTPEEPESDEFSASDAAAGGDEVAGREKRESIIFKKPSISEGNSLMYKLAR
jgi:hypothetical protein